MKNIHISLVLAGLVLLITSCKKDTIASHPHVAFKIAHYANSELLQFDTLKYTALSKHKYKVTKLQYIISGIVLHNQNGEKVSYNTYHYVDAKIDSKPLINPDIEVKNGTYTSISLIFGIDSAVNKTGLFTELPEIGMEWPNNGMQKGGYHYMKLEGIYDSANVAKTIKGFKIHTGPTMGKSFEVKIDLPNSGFVVDNSDKTVELKFDIDNLLNTPTPYNWDDYSAQVMMDMSAQKHIQNNGSNVISIIAIN